MNDDYLWDKTGEPDTKVRELENILGTLKYQPRPLEIPESMPVGKRRLVIPISLAAAVSLVLLGVALWLGFNRQTKTPVVVVPAERESPRPANVTQPNQIEVAINNEPAGDVLERRPNTGSPRPRRVTRAGTQVSLLRRAEAEKAKAELLLALRLTSVKLNLAQKRTQGAPAHQIRNQHKVG